MGWEASGFRELMEDISAMAARLDAEDENGNAAKSILAHAAEPIHEQMRHNASTDPQRSMMLMIFASFEVCLICFAPVFEFVPLKQYLTVQFYKLSASVYTSNITFPLLCDKF